MSSWDNYKKKNGIKKSTNQTTSSSESTKSKINEEQGWFSYKESMTSPNTIYKPSLTEIAPIATTPKEEKDTWFSSGAFSDGYDFGDITKTILGTAGDITTGATKGIFRIGEGLGDLISYGVAGTADLLGNDDYADRIRKNAAVSKTDEMFAPIENFVDPYSVIGEKGDAVSEGLGYVGAILATGGVAGAAGLGTLGATALTTGLTGLSSMGGGMSEAYQGGATDGEALMYGVISGVAEAGSELIFGGLGKAVNAVGISKGLSSLDDAFAKKISSKLTSQLSKNLAEYTVKAGAEGVEEVISGIATGIGKKMTYMSDEDLVQIMKDEKLLDQFISGAVVSGIAQAPGLVKTTNEGKPFIDEDNQAQIQGLQQQIARETEELNKAQDAREKQIRQEKINVLNEELNELTNAQTITEQNNVETVENIVQKNTNKDITVDTANTKAKLDTIDYANNNQITELTEEMQKIKEEADSIGINTVFYSGKTDNPYLALTHEGTIYLDVNEVDGEPSFSTRYSHDLLHALARHDNAGIKETINELKERIVNESSSSIDQYVESKGYSSENLTKKQKLDMAEEVLADYVAKARNGYEIDYNLPEDIEYVLNQAVQDGITEAQIRQRESIQSKGKSTTDNQGREVNKDIAEELKDSKVRDDKGNLLTVYHGTPNGGFTEFDISKRGTATDVYGVGDYGKGFYFTPVKEGAESYTKSDNVESKNPQVYETYLNLKNPLRLDIISSIQKDINALSKEYGALNIPDAEIDKVYEKYNITEEQYDEMSTLYDNLGDNWQDIDISEYGYDGIINENRIEYVAFDPKQIKILNEPNNKNTQSKTQNTPTRQEIDNLLDIQKNKSGSEYARAFFEMRDKYGEAKLYKALNEAYSRQKAGNNEVVEQVEEAIAPLQETISNLSEQLDTVVNSIEQLQAPTSQDIAEKQRQENFEHLPESEMPTEIDETELAPIEDTYEDVSSPVQERDIDEVGNRKVKAYQYEHPEVRPYFQVEADNMLGELSRRIEGERYAITDQDGYPIEWTGVTREIPEDIAYLKDNYGYSYAEIEKGLKAIIEDNGAENNAVSKRLEILIDERLTNGYVDFLEGYPIPPNQEYKNLLIENDAADYYSNLAKTLDDADMAPEQTTMSVEPKTETSKQTIPMKAKTAQNPFALSDEQTSKIQELKDDTKKWREIYSKSYSNDRHEASRRIKGIAMQNAAEIRKIIQGDWLIPVEGGLTSIELNKEISRLKSNYIGKEVLVNGKVGVITGNSFGKVGVEFADGSQQYVEKDLVKPSEDIDGLIQEQQRIYEQYIESQQNIAPEPTKTNTEAKYNQTKQTIPSSSKVAQNGNTSVESINNEIRELNKTVQSNPNLSEAELIDLMNKLEELSNKRNKVMNPLEISKLTPEDANTTPKLRQRRVAKGNKLSSFYENATETTQMLSKEAREYISKNDNVKFYQGITNEQSLAEAYNRLQKGGQAETVKWLGKDAKSATATDVAEGWILLKQYQDTGDYDSMVEIAKKMREMGTAAGQTVQAFNIMSRLTPEGMVKYAQSELSEAYDRLVQGKTKEWIKANQDKFTLKPQETAFIINNMKEVQNMEDGYEKKVKLAEIQKMLQDKIPPELGQSIRAYMRISMLLNPKTQVRNVFGNLGITPVNAVADVIASRVDKMIAHKTNVRTTGNIDLEQYTKGFKQGISQSYNDFKKGINTRNMEGNRFEVTEGKSFNDSHALGKILNKIDNFSSFLLDAGDRGFYEGVFMNSINNQKVLNNTDTVTQEMIDIATSEALQRTWQDNNKYTKFVMNIRQGLNNINVKGYGLGDVLIPFAKTPANLTKAIIDYSPVGLVTSITKGNKLKNAIETGQFTAKMQHEFVQDLGKATAGTLLYVLGYALAKSGAITGSGDDDKDVKNFLKNTMGVNPYSIKIGEVSFTYDWAQPIAAPFAIMANVVQKSEEGQTLQKAIENSLDVAGNVLFEQSFMESINTVLSNNDGIFSGLIEAMSELPSRAVPTFAKQIADMIDGTQRQSFVYDDIGKTAINKVTAKIPFLADDLAPTVNTLGSEVEKYGGDNNLFNVFLNPSTVNKENTNEVAEEIYRLYQETGDKTIMPRQVAYYVNSDGEKINLTPEQRAEFQTISGTMTEDNIRALMNSDIYNSLNDTEKADIVAKVVNYSYNKAQSEVIGTELSEAYQSVSSYQDVGGNVSDYYLFNNAVSNADSSIKKETAANTLMNMSITDQQKAYLYTRHYSTEEKANIVIDSEIPYDYFLLYDMQGFTADKDDEGNSISGSKKEKVFNYINDFNLDIPQKVILFKMEYPKDKDYVGTAYNEQVVSYVDNLGLSFNDVKTILEELGMEVDDEGYIYW